MSEELQKLTVDDFEHAVMVLADAVHRGDPDTRIRAIEFIYRDGQVYRTVVTHDTCWEPASVEMLGEEPFA